VQTLNDIDGRPRWSLWPHRHRRSVGRSCVLIAALMISACSTGDGKTLRPPNVPTVPPTPITVAETQAEPADGLDGTLASLPLDVPALPGEDVAPDPDANPGVDLDEGVGQLTPQRDALTLIAPWFDSAAIESINSCDGSNISPALSWTGVPDGTVEMAVSMIDESIGDGTPFVHWVIAGLNPADVSLSEGVVPLGAIQAVNSFGNIGYDGPCPPLGDSPHLYRITLHALSQQVELADGSAADDQHRGDVVVVRHQPAALRCPGLRSVAVRVRRLTRGRTGWSWCRHRRWWW